MNNRALPSAGFTIFPSAPPKLTEMDSTNHWSSSFQRKKKNNKRNIYMTHYLTKDNKQQTSNFRYCRKPSSCDQELQNAWANLKETLSVSLLDHLQLSCLSRALQNLWHLEDALKSIASFWLPGKPCNFRERLARTTLEHTGRGKAALGRRILRTV